jgi:hypothetical protein
VLFAGRSAKDALTLSPTVVNFQWLRLPLSPIV